MQPRDRARLAQMIAVVRRRLGEQGEPGFLPAPASLPAPLSASANASHPLAGPGEAPPLRLDAWDRADRREDDDDTSDDGDGPMPTGRYSGQRLMARVEATK